MTAFGGAITDPTKIMGGRICAYIVDTLLIGIALVLAFVLVVEAPRESMPTRRRRRRSAPRSATT